MIRQWVPAWSAVVLGCVAAAPSQPAVHPGIDVLLTDSLHLITGRRVGLLTNQTGVDAGGVTDLTRLLGAGIQVTAIFSPEHGYRGALDQEVVEHGVDSASNIRIWSLYGDVRAPTSDMLLDIDILLVDLHDIGARPYTFISTALLTMQSAQAQRIPVIILDRPDPLGGVHVQGPVLDRAESSFVGMLPVPIRHGMTLGELAHLGNEVLGIQADLTVVPASGWRRDQWFDQTGLPWVRPSPNLPDLESATHYPGLVVFEGTNLSVGRGTPIAFQVVGAPWLDPAAVRAWLGQVPGVAVADTVFTPVAPADGKYANERLPAIKVHVTDRGTYDPTLLAARLLAAIRDAHPDRLAFNARTFDRLAGSDRWRLDVLAGRSGEETWRSWQLGVAEFTQVREAYLLYR
ncbi:MAG: DUF1343 domain-containing protein [Gemmatimonadetes bacterium]|nr:DUF1343 domain-containing protein [Gemmatimonadota bacterium]